jgi:hypothetical protein
MKPKPKKSKRFNYKCGIFMLITVVSLILLSQPKVMCAPKRSYVAEAINNAKQIGIALFSFADEYDKYPSPATAPEVAEAYPDQPYDLTGNSSNAIFRQFFTSGITESEQMFYARFKKSQKPDGNISTGELLKKGECGFSYISNISPKDNPKTPIVLAPLIPGTKKFDTKPFDGKAIVLRIDNTVQTYEIKKDGTIHDKDGDIISPNHPIWNGKAPTIHYPE